MTSTALDSSTLLASAQALREAHARGDLGGEIMPEDALIGVVEQGQLMDVITLGMSLNFQRNSYTLWNSIRDGYVSDDAWVFDTDSVGTESDERLRESLTRHKIALQPNKHVWIWRSIASALSRHGGSARLVAGSGSSVAELRAIVQGTEKKSFPYLSGPKIFNYWTYVLESYCGVTWVDRHEISVAPDTHVLQASVRLGLVGSEVLDGSATSREAVSHAWHELLTAEEMCVIDIHTPLWLWSKAGFPAVPGVSTVVNLEEDSAVLF